MEHARAMMGGGVFVCWRWSERAMFCAKQGQKKKLSKKEKQVREDYKHKKKTTGAVDTGERQNYRYRQTLKCNKWWG
jgi:hypothetical protein